MVHEYKIIKTKFTSAQRTTYTITSYIVFILAVVIVSSNFKHNTLMIILSMIFCAIYLVVLMPLWVNKYKKIGRLICTNTHLFIETEAVKKQIAVYEIDSIKLKYGTGSSKRRDGYDSYLIAITLKNKEVVNIHSRTFTFKDKNANGFVVGDNSYLFETLKKLNLPYRFDNTIQESDCIDR